MVQNTELDGRHLEEFQALGQSQIITGIFIALIPVVLAFSFIIFILYRSRREASFREREAQLRLRRAEGELKALKSQINPHFIFNCLNSIHHFIQSDENQLASNYLIRFSRLIRYVLESSEKNWVSLDEEINANRIFLEIEKYRANSSFDFYISIPQDWDTENIYVPPMLLQPFLENSVWHGVEKGGEIRISFEKKSDEYLQMRLFDTGKKEQARSEIDLSHFVQKSSLGLKLIRDQFKTLNELRGTAAGFEVKKYKDMGQEIYITIPMQEDD